jgi:hypothetical protein
VTAATRYRIADVLYAIAASLGCLSAGLAVFTQEYERAALDVAFLMLLTLASWLFDRLRVFYEAQIAKHQAEQKMAEMALAQMESMKQMAIQVEVSRGTVTDPLWGRNN